METFLDYLEIEGYITLSSSMYVSFANSYRASITLMK